VRSEWGWLFGKSCDKKFVRGLFALYDALLIGIMKKNESLELG
jgi:hypothetical protein